MLPKETYMVRQNSSVESSSRLLLTKKVVCHNHIHQSVRRGALLNLQLFTSLIILSLLINSFTNSSGRAVANPMMAPINRAATLQTACGDGNAIRQAITRQLNILAGSRPPYQPPTHIPIIRAKLRQEYEDYYGAAGLEQDIALKYLVRSRSALDRGDLDKACKLLTIGQKATYAMTEADTKALAVWEKQSKESAKVLKAIADVGNAVGQGLVCTRLGPQACTVVTQFYAGLDYAAERSVEGEDVALRHYIEASLLNVASSYLSKVPIVKEQLNVEKLIKQKYIRPIVKSRYVAGVIKSAATASGAQLKPYLSRQLNDVLTAAGYNIADTKIRGIIDAAVDKFINSLKDGSLLNQTASISEVYRQDFLESTQSAYDSMASGLAPDILSTSPAGSASDVAVGLNRLSVTFSEPIQSGSLVISLSDSKGGTIQVSGAAIADDTLVVSLSTPLSAGTSYTAIIQAGAVRNLEGTANETYQWGFITLPTAISVGVDAVISNTGGVGLNLRRDPGLTGAKVTTLPDYAPIKIVGGPTKADGYTWWQVSSNGQVGWSATGDWLSPSDSQGVRTGAEVVVSNTGGVGLNLRSEPGLSGSKITTLPEGTRMAVIGGPYHVDGYSWWNVSGEAGEGYSAIANWLLPASPAPSTGPRVEGYLDVADCSANVVSGWAADRNQPNTSVSVDIYDGAVRIGTVLAIQYRPDVGNHLGDNGYHGFTFQLGDRLKDGLSHKLGIKFANTDIELSQSPKSLTCPTQYTGYVDAVDCQSNAVSGWAADRNELNTSIGVDIYDGDTLLETVVADQSRPDVGAILGDNGIHGFVYQMPDRLKDGRPHSIQVKFGATALNLTSSPQSLTCAQPSYEGFHDAVDCDFIRGWAWNKSQPNMPVGVQIYDGDILIGTALADQFRQDLLNEKKGQGYHGFNFPSPARLKDGQPHSVRVKIADTNVNLTNTPKQINSACGTQATNYIGYVDGASCDTLSGWAADKSSLNQAIYVNIYDGNTLLATTLANQPRPDVGGLLGDNGLHGFRITTPESLKDRQQHTLSVRFESSAISLTNSPKSLTCGAEPNYDGWVDFADCSVIRGWAADKNRPNTSINVRIYDGGTLVTEVTASQLRSDVGTYLKDNGQHGFNIATPDVFKTGQHTLSVKFESSSTNLSNSPKSLSCGAPPAYEGWVDFADCNVIRGWAADKSRLNTSINVGIYDGTTLLTSVPASQLRSDVGAYLKDNGLHGFNVATPDALKTGQHTLSVKFESLATQLSNSPKSLNCVQTSQPQVSSISPNPVQTFNADQNMQVSGANFQQGLTVDVFNSAGAKLATLSGSQVQNVLANSFTMVVSLGSSPNTFGIEVVNPDGGRSQRFGFSTTAPAPSVSSLNPTPVPVVNADQSVQVSGNNFQFNLTVDVFNSGGTKLATLSGTQVLGVTPTSFTMKVNLGSAPGSFGIEVVNPSGGRSSRFTFSTH